MTPPTKPIAVLFKDPPSTDEYTHLLDTRLGLQVHYVPVLITTTLAQQLSNLAPDHQCRPRIVVTTSARASGVLAQYWPFPSNTLVHVWVVGKATANPLKPLEQSGALRLFCDEAGNADRLAAALIGFIHQTQDSLPIILLKGDKSLNTIPNKLDQANLKYVEIQVYATAPCDPYTLARLIPTSGLVEWWVFFSPSGVNAVLQCTPLRPPNVKIAAIGKTTAEHLAKVGWPIYAVASAPNPMGLVDAMASLDGSTNYTELY